MINVLPIHLWTTLYHPLKLSHNHSIPWSRPARKYHSFIQRLTECLPRAMLWGGSCLHKSKPTSLSRGIQTSKAHSYIWWQLWERSRRKNEGHNAGEKEDWSGLRLLKESLGRKVRGSSRMTRGWPGQWIQDWSWEHEWRWGQASQMEQTTYMKVPGWEETWHIWGTDGAACVAGAQSARGQRPEMWLDGPGSTDFRGPHGRLKLWIFS